MSLMSGEGCIDDRQAFGRGEWSRWTAPLNSEFWVAAAISLGAALPA